MDLVRLWRHRLPRRRVHLPELPPLYKLSVRGTLRRQLSVDRVDVIAPEPVVLVGESDEVVHDVGAVAHGAGLLDGEAAQVDRRAGVETKLLPQLAVRRLVERLASVQPACRRRAGNSETQEQTRPGAQVSSPPAKLNSPA